MDAFDYAHKSTCAGPYCKAHDQAFCPLCPPCCDSGDVEEVRAMLFKVRDIIEASRRRQRVKSYAELRARFLERYASLPALSEDLDAVVEAAVREAVASRASGR